TGMKSNFKRNIAPALENKKIVLFVGRFCAPKNLSLWVDVAEVVSRQMYDVAFVMVGNGPMLDKVRLFVRQKKIEERFYFLGHVEHKSLPQVYAAADVFLLTSHYEGFGRVILESYLSGIPVVSTDVGGVRDLVDTGNTGFLLSCGDCQGLADTVMRLMEDDRIRERFGNAGHKKIVTQFALKELTEKLIDCWTNT
ncbi:MAG: glycosyltransferase family 4 protein, partial [Calditrichia bacterium]